MKNKQLRVVIVVVLALILTVAGLTTKTMLDSNKQFHGDGYVLIPSRDTLVTTNVNEQYYFSAGTNYRKKYGQTIEFKDTSNKAVSMGTEEFVHYNDGSLGAFTKGVVMDLAEIGDNQISYYGVSDKTTILKQGQNYQMSYLGSSLVLNEFVWKIADDTFMIVSPEITLQLTNDIQVVLEDYVQVQYVAGGIARLVHQRGTYQTVSDDAFLITDGGFELKLTERAFYNGLEKAVSLDEMVIDSSSNLIVDENEESLKIPTFRVVNGKDGENGSDGQTGEDGTTGENGESGDSGEKGKNGYDGLEGNSGEWGYDGQTGENGNDAEHAESSDGIVGIVQESAPTVGIDAESYEVGINSVEMMLKINDPNGMLTSDDLICTIYKRDDMTQVYQTTIGSGMTGGTVSTRNLEPGVDYVFIVEGSYESDANGLFSGVNFLTKIFRTDELGLSIEKVQVTEDSIIVKTVKTDDSLVSSYSIGLYLGDENTSITTLSGNTYQDGTEFIFKKNVNVVTGTSITPDTEYKVALTTIQARDGSSVSADISKTVKTLKTKPYYLGADGVSKIDISDKQTKILTSSRYQTATVSADTSIVDEYGGIKGYRYELYETVTDLTTITTPVQTKEVQTMETVTFNIEPDKRYFARVVVLFNDNEKLVELVTNPSEVVSLTHSSYPTVTFINLEHEYDKVSGYVMVEDNSVNQDMLLGHVSADYPLLLTVTAQTGSMHTVKLVTGTTPPEGSADTGDSIEYYYFEVDGLARDLTHTVSVSGYVNDTDLSWSELSSDQKLQKLQYLSGYNINVGSPTPIVLSMRQVPNVGDDLFTIALAFTDADGNDASYEVANMEKITFRLVNSSGVTIGTTANLMDANEENHASDYSNYYASHTTTAIADLPYSAVENHPYSQYVLTDESFGAKGDLRIANGGEFKIYVDSAYDYTQDDTDFPDVTNELEISGELEFEVRESHTRVSDPNSAVEVVKIRNDRAQNPDDSLLDDTIVGLTVDTGYSLSDVHQIIYYIYELTSADDEPIVEDDNPDEVLNKTIYGGYFSSSGAVVKQKTVNITTAEDAGASARPWTVYFNETDPTQATANISDAGDTIFERGKVYFIRYEIVTDGSMEDTATQKKYPHCAYDGLNDMTVPFYRSNVFGIARQEPSIQRYLWDTKTASGGTGSTTYYWKYRLNDPDNAILAYVNFNKTAAAAKVTQYDDFENAFTETSGTVNTEMASLSALYDDASNPKTGYEIVEVESLTNDKWYTLNIPYCIFEKNTRNNYEDVNIKTKVSVPMQVTAVSTINTDITDVNNSATDYAVDGVMVKEVSDVMGIQDEYGYRIKLTLQGSQIERVAGVRVTVTGTTDSGETKTVVYDPVTVDVQNGTSGGAKNYFAYAYLEYAPIVAAGINHRDTTISVEAYYTTYCQGMKSFTEYSDISHTQGYGATDNLFAGNSAWALKQYEITEENGITTYSSAYQRLTSELGVLQKCQVFYKDVNNTALTTNALNGSIFIPRMSADGSLTNIGFADERTLAFKYALSPLAYTEETDDSFSDIMYLKELLLEMDECGAKGVDGSEYYVLEKLERKTLKIDFGNAADNYEKATFHTGDGMPGISYSTSGSSSGMSSVTAQFDIKGSLSGSDKGYYIYLYRKGTSTVIPLKKYRDANGEIYYLAEGGTPTTDQDVLLAEDDTTSAYGLGADASSDGKKVTFAIRGLTRSTEYQVKLMAKDTQDVKQDLFDYKYEEGGRYYEFKTKDNVQLVSSGAEFVYNSYNSKNANFQYAVQGSEGTGMRIFYKVFDENNQEVECGLNTRTEYGYLLEPLGNQVKYYQSDMSLSNPARLNFAPNGPLTLGKTYRIEYYAYSSTNAGAVTNATEPIGFLSKQFTMPSVLEAPRASMRVVSGSNSVTVTVVMYDTQKTIVDGKFYIDAYDMAGNRITTDSTRLTVNVTPGASSTVYQGILQGLPANQSYRIVISAAVDRDNDGMQDTTYTNELTANTISTASATVTTSYTDSGNLTLNLMELVNFDNVDKVAYSIDSSDGSKNYENASKNLSLWSLNGTTYSYTTGFAPESGTYHYTLQFYNGSTLLGSTSGYFVK